MFNAGCLIVRTMTIIMATAISAVRVRIVVLVLQIFIAMITTTITPAIVQKFKSHTHPTLNPEPKTSLFWKAGLFACTRSIFERQSGVLRIGFQDLGCRAAYGVIWGPE